MQLTQPNTQPTHTDLLPGTVISPSTGTNLDGPSPLPVPPHRRRAFAAFQAAEMRDTEIIPETRSPSRAECASLTVPPVNMPNVGPPMSRCSQSERSIHPPSRRGERVKQSAPEVEQAAQQVGDLLASCVMCLNNI